MKLLANIHQTYFDSNEKYEKENYQESGFYLNMDENNEKELLYFTGVNVRYLGSYEEFKEYIN
jgi:hypothetical protein